MATYCIAATYLAGTNSRVAFPEGKTWADVQDWYIKWDTLHIHWKSGEDEEFELNSNGIDVIDGKRPTSSSVYAMDETTGKVDYDVELAAT